MVANVFFLSCVTGGAAHRRVPDGISQFFICAEQPCRPHSVFQNLRVHGKVLSRTGQTRAWKANTCQCPGHTLCGTL